jgi:hypothetical protein
VGTPVAGVVTPDCQSEVEPRAAPAGEIIGAVTSIEGSDGALGGGGGAAFVPGGVTLGAVMPMVASSVPKGALQFWQKDAVAGFVEWQCGHSTVFGVIPAKGAFQPGGQRVYSGHGRQCFGNEPSYTCRDTGHKGDAQASFSGRDYLPAR